MATFYAGQTDYITYLNLLATTDQLAAYAAIVGSGTGSFAEGTVTAPSISFVSDPNTGIRHVAADTFAMVAGGADQATYDINGIHLVNTPTAPTAVAGTNTTQIATTAFTAAAISGLVGAAPGTLDTLNELALALGSDPNFATTVTNAIALKAPLASPTFTGTVGGISKAMVGLGNVDNTSDATKFTSIPLTGVPTAPTAAAGTNTTQIATTAFTTIAINNLIAAAPGTLNTLNELALALGSDPNFATTVTNAIALKAPLANPTFTGTVAAPTFNGAHNGTVGATTPAAGAFTTLSAAINSGGNTAVAATISNTGGNTAVKILGTAGSTMGAMLNARSDGSFHVYSGTTAGTDGTDTAIFSSTGLAVTGAISATGVLNTQLGNASVPSTTNVAQYFVAAANSTTYYAGQYYSGGTSHDVFVGMLPNSVSGSSDSWGVGTVGGGVFNKRLMMDGNGNTLINGTLMVGTAVSGPDNSNSFALSTLYGLLYTNHLNGTGSGTAYSQFSYNGTVIGSITQSGTTAVIYGTASDHRLKANQQPLTGSGERIDALEPTTWEWTRDGRKDAGFIAHKFQAIYPNSVNGIKDETEVQTYEVSPAVAAVSDKRLMEMPADMPAEEVAAFRALDSNYEFIEVSPAIPAVMAERMVNKYQSMQSSSPEVIADIVAELKSLRARVKALEAR